MAGKQVFELDNVNGVMLSLSIDYQTVSKIFTISYKNVSGKSNWPLKSLIMAMMMNLIATYYMRISLIIVMIILIVLSFLFFLWVTHCVQSETLLVLPSMGVQCSTKFVCGEESQFISWNDIDDVIINEVIQANRVLYYLTLLVQKGPNTETQLVPLFKCTKPSLEMIEVVYKEFQSLLSEHVKNLASGDTG